MVQRRSTTRRLSAPLSPPTFKTAAGNVAIVTVAAAAATVSVVHVEKAVTRRGKRTADALLPAPVQPEEEPDNPKVDAVGVVKQELKEERDAVNSDAVTAELTSGDEQQQQPENEEDVTEEECVAVVELDTDTILFREAIERDAQRKVVGWRPFKLPYSSHEIELIEVSWLNLLQAKMDFLVPFYIIMLTLYVLSVVFVMQRQARKVEHRPPPYGKIGKCVFVSKAPPGADLPVHKCNCFAETKVVTTKRETQIASAKALLANGGKRRLRVKGDAAKKAEEEAKKKVVLCGENCHNRMLFISCSEDTCSAPDPSMCSNRAITRKEVKCVMRWLLIILDSYDIANCGYSNRSLRVEYIPGPGFGLVASEPISNNDFVIEYVGEVIDDEECERRMIQYRDRGEVGSLSLLP